ncbi:MAG: OmpH family outer membrane protein [Flavobacteriales bacterium Tduv]
MKKNTILPTLFLLAGGVASVMAQNTPQKIVCVNSSEIIQKNPEFSAAEKQLKNLTEIHDAEFQKLVNQFQKKSEQYEQESTSKKPSENKKRSEELFSLRKRAEKYQKTATEDLEKKQNELLNPVYKKVEEAISKVADKDKTITRVDDCSPGKCVLINKGVDITADVLKELGIKQ